MVITKKIIVPSGQREEELELMVEAEANQYIPFALDEVNLDFQTIGPAPNNPEESEVLIAASRKEKVEDRVAAAEAAGLKPRVMDVESYAMQQAFELISPSLPASGRDQNIALVDIGAHVTHFYVLRNNQFLFSRDQAFGGNQLTHDVQRAFNLTPDEAESAKKSQGLPENYDTDVLQPFMETLALEVTRALQFFFTSTSYNQVDQIVLAGGCALLPGIDELVAKRAGVTTVIANPFANMATSDRIRPAAARAGCPAPDDRLRPRAAELRMIRINLLPHREQKRQARQRQFVSLSIGLTILGLALVALGWVILGAQIEIQESRNNLLKAEIAKLDEQIKEIDKLREQTQALLARKQVVETLQSNRTEAVHVLDQMVRQLPDGIYLKSLKQTGPKIQLVGYAQSSARVSTLMRNIDSSPWLTSPELVEIKSVQSPVAKDLRVNEFTLNVQIKRVAPPDETKAAAPAARAAPRARSHRAGGPARQSQKPERHMTLDDIRRLNIKEVGNWPAPAQGGAPSFPPDRDRRGRCRARLEGPVRRARPLAAGGGQAQGAIRHQEGQGDQLRHLRAAAEGDRAVVRRAPEAAPQQGGDGRAAHGHQPGGPRPRPAVRAVQAGRAGTDGRLLRRAADLREDHRQLP